MRRLPFSEYWKLGWWAKRRPSVLAAAFRDMAWEWARQGVAVRAEVCHELADYYELPLWRQFLAVGTQTRLTRKLLRLQREFREREML